VSPPQIYWSGNPGNVGQANRDGTHALFPWFLANADALAVEGHQIY
jgi:hypothetical protein